MLSYYFVVIRMTYQKDSIYYVLEGTSVSVDIIGESAL